MTDAPDYTRLLDAEIREFIRRTEALCPTDSFAQGIAEYRRRYDAMCQVFRVAHPAGVSADDARLGGVPVRRYRTTAAPGVDGGPVVIYAHGGSLTLGGLDSHDDVCAEICAATGFEVVSPDYRLLPEHDLGDALADMQTVFDQVTGGDARAVVLVGDSAGAYLCAALTHANRGNARLLGQVLIYPGLGGGAAPRGSRARHAHAPLLTLEELKGGQELLGDRREAGGYPVPLRDTDFSGLPPTVAMAAQCDPIADDAHDYAGLIRAAGGQALAFTDEGLVHGHLRARHMSRRAGESFARVLRAIRVVGSGAPLEREAIRRSAETSQPDR